MTEKIKNKIESFLNERIISINPVSGGCINESKILITESGKSYFVKTNNNSVKDMFFKEADGLYELAKSNTIRVPEVIYTSEDFLLIENILHEKKDKLFWENFGRNFAKLHRYVSGNFGFYEDNYIGSTPQLNIPSSVEKDNWTEFYFNKRLLYQYKLTELNGYADAELRKCFTLLEKKLDRILGNCKAEASLLHGDLWNGNFICDETGQACLIDPAVYYGHREADLAMTKLFGGFDDRFYSAYNEEYGLEEEFEYRENIYKLYHVFNHLNLFGRGYLKQAIGLIKYYL